MTDLTARYKSPMPVVVMFSILLTVGYMACFGVIADNKEIVRNRSVQVAAVQREISREEANARQMLDIYAPPGQDWYGKGCGQVHCKGAKR